MIWHLLPFISHIKLVLAKILAFVSLTESVSFRWIWLCGRWSWNIWWRRWTCYLVK